MATDWEKNRKRVLEELALMASFDMAKETHKRGFKLWMNDWLQEDILLLMEAKETLTEEQWKELIKSLRGDEMATDQETKLYFQARDRALERHVEANGLIPEAEKGFATGIRWAIAGAAPTVSESDWVKDKIKTEDNFAFGFVCGVLSRLEAVKGKHYAGSWQKRGEPVVLANVQRKLDRLDQLITTASKAGENLSQTLGDNAVYSIKWLTLRAELDPEEFINWVKEVQGL